MGDLIDSILQGLFDVIFSVMELVLDSFVGRLLYYAETGLCKIVGILNEMFFIFAGIDKVTYDGKDDYLVNIFFNNRSISNVYWAMALIGIALAFAFAIAAVVRKMFDSGGKQQSLSQILTSLVRTIILILSMSAIMVIVLNSTNLLMRQVNMIFVDPGNLDLETTKTFTDEEFAAMGRVLNTIGNYSLNPSYSSRFNINTCFNEICKDMQYLQQQKVFRYYYITRDANGNEVKTWQSVLQKIANSHDLRTELKLDVSYDAVNSAILEAMDVIRNDPSFAPLESYTRVAPNHSYVPLDRYLFLMGTMHAAKNNEYNINAEMTDAVRGPYFTGEKNIYNISQVSKDFDIGFATDYLIVFCSAIALIFDLCIIILNCIARIFNMIFLYIIAPPVFAVQPFDGGGKTKQWMTAFIVQCLSVFGTVLAMHLLLVMLPIVTSSKLVLFQNGTMNIMAKLVMIYGLFEVAKKATGLLTGILADSAGMQAIAAGDMSASANKMVGAAGGVAAAVGKGALKATGKVANFATKPLQNLAKQGYDKTVGKGVNWWNQLGSDAEGQEKAKIQAEAQHSLAVDDAKQQMLADRNGGGDKSGGDSGPGGKPPAPGGPGGKPPAPGGPGGGGDIPKPPPPPPPPTMRDRQLAQAAAAHKRPKVDAQGNMVKPGGGGGAAPPAGGGASTGSQRLGGYTSDIGAVGSRPTLGDKPTVSAPRSKEAPTSRGRPSLAQMEKHADFKAATTSTHTSVGGSVSSGGSYTAESGGSRTSLKQAPPDAPRRPKEAPTLSSRRISLDD